MQNLLALLSMPTPSGEAFTAIQPVVRGDGSFADAFGKAANDSDAEHPAVEATEMAFSTLSWTGPLFVAVEPPTATRSSPGAGIWQGRAPTADSVFQHLDVEPSGASLPLQTGTADSLSLSKFFCGSMPLDAAHAADEYAVPDMATEVHPESIHDSLAGSEAGAALDEVWADPGAEVSPSRPELGALKPILSSVPMGLDMSGFSQELPQVSETIPPVATYTPNAKERNEQVSPDQKAAPDDRKGGTETGKSGATKAPVMQERDAFLHYEEIKGLEGMNGSKLGIVAEPNAVRKQVEADQPGDTASAPAVSAMGSKPQEYEVQDVTFMLTGAATAGHRSETCSPSSSFWERFFTEPALSIFPSAGSGTADLSNGTISPKAVDSAGTDQSIEPTPHAVSSGSEVPVTPPTKDTAAESVRLTAVAPSTEPLESRLTVLERIVPDLAISAWDEGGQLHDGLRHSFDPFAAIVPTGSGAIRYFGTTGVQTPSFAQVATQIAHMLVRNEDMITELALAPEELGRVRLRMEPDAVNLDRMVIMISVERPETLDLLRRHAGELAEAIRDAGYSGADIGFGQSGREGSSEQGEKPSSFRSLPAFVEAGPADVTPMLSIGASLDLRL